jgi:hypothetical protein
MSSQICEHIAHYVQDCFCLQTNFVGGRNCYSTHLLRYLYAKLHQSCGRNLHSVATALCMDAEQTDRDEIFKEAWKSMLSGLGMSPPSLVATAEEQSVERRAFDSAMLLLEVSNMRIPGLNEEQWECIRDFFKSRRHPNR